MRAPHQSGRLSHSDFRTRHDERLSYTTNLCRYIYHSRHCKFRHQSSAPHTTRWTESHRFIGKNPSRVVTKRGGIRRFSYFVYMSTGVEQDVPGVLQSALGVSLFYESACMILHSVRFKRLTGVAFLPTRHILGQKCIFLPSTTSDHNFVPSVPRPKHYSLHGGLTVCLTESQPCLSWEVVLFRQAVSIVC